jgi:hypothetical protein
MIRVPDIIQRLKDAYSTGQYAEIIKTLLPGLFQAAEDGKIVEAPSQTVYELEGIWCRICRANHYRIKKKLLGEDIFFSEETAKARENILREREREAAKAALQERKT